MMLLLKSWFTIGKIKMYKMIKDNLRGFTGKAALYEFSKKVPYGDNKETSFVIASTVLIAIPGYETGYETILFPADSGGKVLNWGELDGSMNINHEKFLDMLEKGISPHKASLDALAETL